MDTGRWNTYAFTGWLSIANLVLVFIYRALHDVKATDVGGRHVRFKAEVDFDGKEITRYYLEQQDLEKMLAVSSDSL